jgi:hypothetical protein
METATLNIVLTEAQHEREETIPAQEEVIGPIPLRNERPAAEILAEAIAESTAPLFIP